MQACDRTISCQNTPDGYAKKYFTIGRVELNLFGETPFTNASKIGAFFVFQLSFGSTSGTGCKNDPLEFITDYSCPSSVHNKVMRNTQQTVDGTTYTGLGLNWSEITSNYGDVPYVCVFKPKVQVLDNWGWCTGSCNSASYDSDAVKGDGCYSERATNDCRFGEKKAWVNYGGYIVVVPVL